MDNIDIEIIITTYNRAEKLGELVFRLLKVLERNAKVIVVDSSDFINLNIQQISEINYIRTLHKNQPYQRYLGYLTSQAEVLIFLDDDMEIVDNDFLNKIVKLFEDKELTGLAIKFTNKEKETSLSKIPSSSLFGKNNILKDIKGWLTGYPRLKPGKFGLCGNRGPQPVGGGLTEWVSGGAFAARRSAMFNNFNYQIFDIFEKRLGMGEDAIIGYGLSKLGNVIFHDELFFLHNDQNNSTYSSNHQEFAERVAFSRLYLSLERARLNHSSILFAKIHYHYYMFWRVAGLLFNYIVNPVSIRLKIVKGTISGWLKAFASDFSYSEDRFRYWHSEALHDISNMIPNIKINGF